MHEPMTDDELIGHDGISPEDKELIAKAVEEHSDSSEGPDRVNALRGFLVGLFEDLVPDDDLRGDLEEIAANWSDGWSYCLKYGKQIKQ